VTVAIAFPREMKCVRVEQHPEVRPGTIQMFSTWHRTFETDEGGWQGKARQGKARWISWFYGRPVVVIGVARRNEKAR
jgi:hypothetical protein